MTSDIPASPMPPLPLPSHHDVMSDASPPHVVQEMAPFVVHTVKRYPHLLSHTVEMIDAIAAANTRAQMVSSLLLDLEVLHCVM